MRFWRSMGTRTGVGALFYSFRYTNKMFVNFWCFWKLPRLTLRRLKPVNFVSELNKRKNKYKILKWLLKKRWVGRCDGRSPTAARCAFRCASRWHPSRRFAVSLYRMKLTRFLHLPNSSCFLKLSLRSMTDITSLRCFCVSLNGNNASDTLPSANRDYDPNRWSIAVAVLEITLSMLCFQIMDR